MDVLLTDEGIEVTGPRSLSPHFEDAQWAALVRGLLPPAAQRELEAHLAAGCAACRSRMDDLERASPAVLPQLEDRERAALLGPAGRAAELLFDSARSPHRGLRGVEHGEVRHFLYAQGSFHIDLLIEQEEEVSPIHVTGQVFDHQRPDLPPEHPFPVVLYGTEGVLALGFTNRQGAFAISCQRQAPRSLGVLLGPNALSLLPLGVSSPA